MVKGRSITYKYKRFPYDERVKDLLSIDLTPKDEQELKKIYDNYNSLEVRRGYEYIIKDIYILISKRGISTSDIAEIYDVGIRTVQIWLKELGLNRTQKEAQQIAVTKRDYKSIRKTFKNTMLNRVYSNELDGSLIENYVRSKLNLLLISNLIDYEVIVGINTLGVIDTEADIPIVIIKNNELYKFIVEVDGFFSHNSNKGIERKKIKTSIAKDKNYTLLTLNTKSYYKKDSDMMYRGELDQSLIKLTEEIIRKVKGI